MQRFSEFFLNHWDLFLAAAFLSGMLVWHAVRNRFNGFQEIGPTEAVGLINQQDALVVDVREDREYKEGHIANSIHIPLVTLKSRLHELDGYKSRPLIVSCRSGTRSAHACGVLAKNNFTALYNLRGGIGAWQSAGLPITKGGKSKKK